jgi:hypothetical protein
MTGGAMESAERGSDIMGTSPVHASGFTPWLAQQNDRNDPAGDFTQVVVGTSKWMAASRGMTDVALLPTTGFDREIPFFSRVGAQIKKHRNLTVETGNR